MPPLVAAQSGALADSLIESMGARAALANALALLGRSTASAVGLGSDVFRTAEHFDHMSLAGSGDAMPRGSAI